MITRNCRVCNQEQEVYKQIYRDGSKHLIIRCGKRVVGIPYEELDVKIVPTGLENKLIRRAQLAENNKILFIN